MVALLSPVPAPSSISHSHLRQLCIDPLVVVPNSRMVRLDRFAEDRKYLHIELSSPDNLVVEQVLYSVEH